VPPADLTPYYDSRYSTLSPSALKSRVRSAFAWLSYHFPRAAPIVGAAYHGTHWGTYAALRQLDVGLDARILDVGAGTGRFLETLRRLGFRGRVDGLDPFLAEDVRLEDIDVTVRKQTLSEVEERYDLVTLVHVLEHLPDPATALASIRALLRPGGAVIVSIPVAGNDVWHRSGTNWVQLDPPRHQILFTQAGVRAAAETAGLQVKQVIHDSTALQFWGTARVRQGKPIVPFGRSMIASTYRIPFDTLRALRANRRGVGDQATFILRAR
jgi:SAM-dependent methyltransferase